MTTKLAKHTPGPWKAVHDFDGDYAIFAEHGGVLASTYADTPEDEANALLIAAAPAILSSMKETLSLVEFYAAREMNAPANNQEAVRDTREKLERFRAAIRAAVGAREENTQ